MKPSSLDKKTEEKIMESIYKFKKNRTLVIVSHRITSLNDCDNIYEIQGGNIRETEYDRI